jgi:hypothetical protein
MCLYCTVHIFQKVIIMSLVFVVKNYLMRGFAIAIDNRPQRVMRLWHISYYYLWCNHINIQATKTILIWGKFNQSLFNHSRFLMSQVKFVCQISSLWHSNVWFLCKRPWSWLTDCQNIKQIQLKLTVCTFNWTWILDKWHFSLMKSNAYTAMFWTLALLLRTECRLWKLNRY